MILYSSFPTSKKLTQLFPALHDSDNIPSLKTRISKQKGRCDLSLLISILVVLGVVLYGVIAWVSYRTLTLLGVMILVLDMMLNHPPTETLVPSWVNDQKYDYLVSVLPIVASIVWPLTLLSFFCFGIGIRVYFSWQEWMRKPSIFSQIVTSLLGRIR